MRSRVMPIHTPIVMHFYACNCVEHMIYLWNNLKYLSLPTCQKIYMFGDKKYVVDSAIHPHAKIHKRHTTLYFHKVQEDIVSNMVPFYHVYGVDNTYGIISNNCSYSHIWKRFWPLILCMGNTMELLYLESGEDDG